MYQEVNKTPTFNRFKLFCADNVVIVTTEKRMTTAALLDLFQDVKAVIGLE